MMQVEKINIAIEELEDSLTAYFAGRYHSATVLAGAAEQLLAGYVLKHGGTPEWLRSRSSITKIANAMDQADEAPNSSTTEKTIGDLMNRAYNNSKHAGKDDHVLRMDPKDEARALIERALSNFGFLDRTGKYDLPALELAERFMIESAQTARFED